MIHIHNVRDGLPMFKALSSEVRVAILELLMEHNQLNMQEIATKLNLTGGAITTHIKKLHECGLVHISTAAGKQGIQKICYLPKDKLVVDIGHESLDKTYEADICIGHYSTYQVSPTCGIATADRVIGEVDDPRYFADPERIHAQILWFTKGFIEYRIPNYLKADQTLCELQFTLEISSEAPGVCNNWPSNIYFHLNGFELGHWISPGDFGDFRGLLNPSWWPSSWNQYGLLKLLSINHYGTFVDGLKISDTTLLDIGLNYRSDIILRLSVPEGSKNAGGLTLYGEGFGNYSQGIHVRMIYA